ncbi:MAG: hypothetical protein WCK89_10665 [bacterium]
MRIRILLPIACCLLPLFVQAGEIFSSRLYTIPNKIYVNQAFELHFELEVTFGNEVENIRISGIPNSPDLLTLGQLQTVSQNRIMRDKQAINVLHFTASARCHQPIEQTFQPTLLCVLSERRSVGFFSQVQSVQKQHKFDPFTLRVLPLPEAGRPAHFSGAIGSFRLSGGLSQTSVHPGDLITLSLELSGQGWMTDVSLPAPAPSPLFKTYPSKERLREPLRIQTEQVFIPTATNATEIAAMRFCFFNPSTERYEESVAGPFRLTFTTEATAPKTDDVRVIDTAAPVTSEALPPAVTLERMNLTLRQAAPLLIGCAGALAAFFVFFLFYGRRTRLACVIGATLLAAGIGTGYALGGKTVATTCTLTHHTEVLFAPSHAAATLFALNPGTAVIPLENAGTWVRIDASGRRGWIPSALLLK